jgi:5-oxoprolinase (ATP-hydrolysing)
MALADVVQEAQEPVNETYDESSRSRLEERLSNLRSQVKYQLINQGIQETDIAYEMYLNMRYQGTETLIMVQQPPNEDFKTEFQKTHLREFSFCFPDDKVIFVDDVRVRGIGTSQRKDWEGDQLGHQLRGSSFSSKSGNPAPSMVNQVYFPKVGHKDTPVFLLQDLPPGLLVEGPAIIVDQTQTLVVAPGTLAKILRSHVVIKVLQTASTGVEQPTVVDHIQLSVFGHRFMSIAEQMGRALQKTAVSLNIKERLDFSCALFGPEGTHSTQPRSYMQN